MKTKDEYIEKLAAELKEWSAKIDSLTAKAEDASAEVKLRCVQDFNALRTQEQIAIDKMKELEEASGDAWIQAKETADVAWADLKTGLALTMANFK